MPDPAPDDTLAQSATLPALVGDRLAGIISIIAGPQEVLALREALDPHRPPADVNINYVTRQKFDAFFTGLHEYLSHLPGQREAILAAADKLDRKPGDNDPLTRSFDEHGTARRGLEDFLARGNEAGFELFCKRLDAVVHEQFQDRLVKGELLPLRVHTEPEPPSPSHSSAELALAAPLPVEPPTSSDPPQKKSLAQDLADTIREVWRNGRDGLKALGIVNMPSLFLQVQVKPVKEIMVGDATQISGLTSDIHEAVISQGVAALPPDVRKAALAYGLAAAVMKKEGSTGTERLDQLAQIFDPNTQDLKKLLETVHSQTQSATAAPNMANLSRSEEVAIRLLDPATHTWGNGARISDADKKALMTALVPALQNPSSGDALDKLASELPQHAAQIQNLKSAAAKTSNSLHQNEPSPPRVAFTEVIDSTIITPIDLATNYEARMKALNTLER